MIYSMTGYGSAEAASGQMACVVEIKTVNNRYFKTRLKVPELVAFLEDDIENLLRQEISRGMVNYVLHLKDETAETFFNINEKNLKSYMEKLARIASTTSMNWTIDIGNLLNLPEVVAPAVADKQTAENIKQLILGATRKALEALRQMRRAEGAALADELQKHCDQIKSKLEMIKRRAPVVLNEYADKLRKKADELLAGSNLNVDKQVLAMEVAVFAERSDISEEVARLESHISQFTSCLQEGCSPGKAAPSQAGRRLDFLSQEMLREANTIASKAGDAEIIHGVVDIKCLIDRIKEQVQNVE